MIRSRKGYRFVSEMSLSRDVLITLIRSEHGYRYVIKMSLLSTLSFKKVTLTLMSMLMFLTWSKMPWKYQESCILTQCSSKIVIRYLLDQDMYHTSTMREGWSQRPLRNMVTISDKSEKKQEKVRKVRNSGGKSEKSEEKSARLCLLFSAPYPGKTCNVKLYSTSSKCPDINNISTGGEQEGCILMLELYKRLGLDW